MRNSFLAVIISIIGLSFIGITPAPSDALSIYSRQTEVRRINRNGKNKAAALHTTNESFQSKGLSKNKLAFSHTLISLWVDLESLLIFDDGYLSFNFYKIFIDKNGKKYLKILPECWV